MGGGTGTGGSEYKVMTLAQPWGETEEEVRMRRQRSRLMRWWLSLSQANETPEFLTNSRKDTI